MQRTLITTMSPGSQVLIADVPGKPQAVIIGVGATASAVFINVRVRNSDHALTYDNVQPGTPSRTGSAYIVLPNMYTGNVQMAVFCDTPAAYARTVAWLYEDSPLLYRPQVPGA